MSPHRRLFAIAVALIAGTGLILGGATPATAAPAFTHYVALGDSYASGPFIPDQRTDPVGCLRSTHNYPADLAAALGVPEFVDVSCGGAVTDDMTAPQSVTLGSNPPQFDALTPDTDLVTVTIGGNDIGFVDILTTCATLSVTDPTGNPCQQHYTAGGTDQLSATIAATAPKIAAVLAGIRQRSPQAKVVVVGYLRILPPSGRWCPSRSATCPGWTASNTSSTR
jgi:lysophospholipase L1-like esterase